MWDFKQETSIDFKKKDITIKVSCMYQGLGAFISFEFLSEISELLGTKKIDIRDQWYESGCETCDYGSSDNATILIRGAKI